MTPPNPTTPTGIGPLNRRALLKTAAAGFGWMAFQGLSATASGGAETGQGTASVRPVPHHRSRAQRVIFLCMQGGPSHQDTFDHKPRLRLDHGKPGPSRGKGRNLAAEGGPARRGEEPRGEGYHGAQISQLLGRKSVGAIAWLRPRRL